MTRILTRLLCLLVCLFSLACAPAMAPIADTAPPPEALRMATLNVHYIRPTNRRGIASLPDWARRQAPLNAAFQAINADIFALQEVGTFPCCSQNGANPSLDWLLSQNPGYSVAAHGPGEVFPQIQPILYRHDRVSLLDQGYFFFSRTPGTLGSPGYRVGSYPTFASWASFRQNGAVVHVVNVHLDVTSWANRRASAALIGHAITPWLEAGERVMVIGDMNSFTQTRPVQTLARTLTVAPVRGATFHFYRGLHLYGAIDHMAYSEGVTPISPPQVVRGRFAGGFPSDHYPVFMDVVLD